MIRALLLICLGAASFAAVYFLMPADEPPAGSSEPAAPASPTAIAEVLSTPSQEALASLDIELRPGAELVHQAEAPRAVRDVTPDTMTAGPRATGTLARVDPPAPTPQARTERLFNPIVIAAGVIKVRKREVRLAGIAAPEFDRMCGEGPTAWPCGRLARAALRSFIRGRAIECEVPAGADKIPDPAECLVAGNNIAEWLVAQGWAKRSGEPFEKEEAAAREARLGLWSELRPDTRSAQLAATGG